jgi:hypothetical protein
MTFECLSTYVISTPGIGEIARQNTQNELVVEQEKSDFS